MNRDWRRMAMIDLGGGGGGVGGVAGGVTKRNRHLMVGIRTIIRRSSAAGVKALLGTTNE